MATLYPAMDALSCLLSMGLACGLPEPGADSPPDSAAPAVETEPTASADPQDVADPSEQAVDPQSATAQLLKVQAYYDGTADLTSSFKQTYEHQVYGTGIERTGKLKIKKPGMMVWDYTKSSDPDFYADGNKLWIVEQDTRQVVTQKVSKSDFAGAVKFLFGGSQLREEFWVRWASKGLVEQYGMKNLAVIELWPKQSNVHYKRLLLGVDRASGRVDNFVVLNADGSTNHFVLSGVQRNPGLSTADFHFEVPDGFVVVRE